jgi:DNA transformation protein
MALDADTDVIADLFRVFGPVRVRRMFGGAGIYADEVMFGLIADDALYLKADPETSRAFAAEGEGPFVYGGKGKPVTMSYWRVPTRLYDEPDELARWAKVALAVAKNAATAAARRRSKPARIKG